MILTFRGEKDGGTPAKDQFKLHKKYMSQLPDGGIGYIARSELLEKLDIPEHRLYFQVKHRAQSFKRPFS